MGIRELSLVQPLEVNLVTVWCLIVCQMFELKVNGKSHGKVSEAGLGQIFHFTSSLKGVNP